MNSQSNPSREVLDPDTMAQLLDLDDGGLGLLQEMYELFRDDTPARVTLLEAAIRDGDMVQVGDTAHAVKGAASTMGAPKVRALAQSLEAGARTGNFSEAPQELLGRLKTAFAEAVVALETFIASKA
jgi:HPt (histidine-containing phosphotransfer) domain-containing protein